MNHDQPYFLCGIGGSGMLPLALILRSRGIEISGSDRALDQGRTSQKFDFLRAQGIKLYPQDGSGITSSEQIIVASAAIEQSVPDIHAARLKGATIKTRAELLAELFNAAARSIAIGGTSGKSTTTGMIAWIMKEAGQDPTVMNGAVMKNFVSPGVPFASAIAGHGDMFVSEVDESDGSIAHYKPQIAVLNNISLDHKSLEELRDLFGAFIAEAEIAVLNLDNEESARIAAGTTREKLITFSLYDSSADLLGSNLVSHIDGIEFEVREHRTGRLAHVHLQVPGAHNVANALAALGAARAAGIGLGEATRALSRFTGIKRRLETVGAANDITIIDDFAHNPDKIAATLETLHAFSGRLLIMFQPHGYGPLKLMKQPFIDCFSESLSADDVLLMPEPVYYGGTTDRAVTSGDITSGIAALGRNAIALPDRTACGAKLIELARPHDRILIMGARDDTLSEFAYDLLQRLGGRS